MSVTCILNRVYNNIMVSSKSFLFKVIEHHTNHLISQPLVRITKDTPVYTIEYNTRLRLK